MQGSSEDIEISAKKGLKNMINKEGIILTEEDKKIINKLKDAPMLKLISAGRMRNNIKDILTIEDLTAEKLKELLPKIDLSFCAEYSHF